jgi:DNA-binding transcriptional LysR family regulator
MNSFEQLKSMVVFAQVVEQGNLSLAAKHIGLSRAVVSYHLKKLESQLGVQLLNRSTRSIMLTQEGKNYYQRCRVITEQANAANEYIETLKNEPVGLLKVTCPVNVGLHTIVPALNEFLALYPKIELDINLTDDVVNILKEGVDLAIRGAPLVDTGLQAKKLATLATCLCGSPEYFRLNGRPTTVQELAQHQWVIYQLAARNLVVSKANKQFNIPLQGNISTNNSAARTAFVEGGHGLGRIPSYDASAKIKAGTLEVVMADYKLNDIEVYGVFLPGSANTKRMRLLIDFLSSYFQRQQNIQI